MENTGVLINVQSNITDVSELCFHIKVSIEACFWRDWWGEECQKVWSDDLL